MSKIKRIIRILILPLLLLSLSYSTSLTNQNITYLINSKGLRFPIFILLFLLSGYYLSLFSKIKKYLNNSLIYPTLFCSTMLLVVLIPYKSATDFISSLHTDLALFGSILFLFYLAQILFKLSHYSFDLFNQIYPYYLIWIAVCLALFIFYNKINTLIEIVFILGINLCLEKMLYLLVNASFDILYDKNKEN